MTTLNGKRKLQTVSAEKNTNSGDQQHRPQIRQQLDKQTSSSRRPRLLIKKMVLENFKSYAGKREIGPFHKCFSSIVGPNGSGKSNVIDSLLFIFGKRAKKIRLKKLSELIHLSAEHPNLTYCKVAVHFCTIIDHPDDEGYDIVKGSEFEIARTANKKSSSTYYINNKRSSFSEVAALLKTKGIDLINNRFLILQGEVEQISLMKPKALRPGQVGFLEYLEDIIGSNKYVEAIEQAYESVDKLTESRQGKLNRVKAVEKEKDQLEGAKSEAEECLKKERELFIKQSQIHKLYEERAIANKKAIMEKKSELEEKLGYERKKLSDETKGCDELRKQFEKKKKEHDKLAKQMAETKVQFVKFERKDIKYREDLKHEKIKCKKLKAKISRQNTSVKNMETTIKKNCEQLPILEERVISVGEHKEKEEKIMEMYFEKVKEKTEPIRIKMEQKQKELVPLKKHVNKFQQNVDVLQSELKLFSDKTQTAQKKYKAAQTTIKSNQERVQTLKEKTKELTVKSQETQNNLTKSMAELKNLQEEEKNLRDIRQKLRVKLETARASRSSSQNLGRVHGALMKQKREGRILGIHDKLGALGAIDERYDVAISTACPALKHIVVDNTATGQKCVNFLRQHNLGRATFIMLDKMNKYSKHAMTKIKTPENVPRLYDLIRPKDKQYLPAFYFGIRDTLVAKDLTQAVRIANSNGRRWRVVTLQGALIETSGTMSGGGNKVHRGAMSSKIVPDTEGASESEIRELGEQVRETERKFNDLIQKKRLLERNISSLNKAISKQSTNKRKHSLELDTLVKELESSELRIKELEKDLTLTNEEENKVAQLKKDVARAKSDLADAHKNSENLLTQIERLKAEIMDAGGAKLRMQKAKVDSLSKQLDDTSTSINKIKVENKNKEKKIKKNLAEITASEKEMESAKKKIDKLMETFKKLEDDAFKVMEAYKKGQKELQGKRSEMGEVQADFDDIKKRVQIIRNVEIDLSHKLEDFNRMIEDNSNKISHWQEKFQQALKQVRQRERYLVHGIDSEEDAKVHDDEKNMIDENSEKKIQEDEKKEMNEKSEQEGHIEEEKEQEIKELDENKLRKYVPLTGDQLKRLDVKDLQYAITILEEQLNAMKPNMQAIADYQQKEKEYTQRVEELDQTTHERDAARKVYESLRKKRLDEFMAGYTIITMKLKEMYQMLTLGGDAELELVDTLDPFSEGIVFSVRPPKKSWKNIQNLSGGEKTLSSLSLVFALHHFKPTPLYVMDEIDAALDFKNVSIVANYIKERTKDAQFIIISLRNNMFELANHLVGIYKTNNSTKSITIDPRHFSVPVPTIESNKENINRRQLPLRTGQPLHVSTTSNMPVEP